MGGQSDEINTDQAPEDDDLMILTVRDIRNLDVSLAIAGSLEDGFLDYCHVLKEEEIYFVRIPFKFFL